MLDLMMPRMRVGCLSHLKCAATGIDVLLFYFDSRNPPRNFYPAKTQQILIFALDLCMYQCCYAYASASASARATIQHSKALVCAHFFFVPIPSFITPNTPFFVRLFLPPPFSHFLCVCVYAPHVTVLIFAFLLSLLFSHR